MNHLMTRLTIRIGRHGYGGSHNAAPAAGATAGACRVRHFAVVPTGAVPRARVLLKPAGRVGLALAKLSTWAMAGLMTLPAGAATVHASRTGYYTPDNTPDIGCCGSTFQGTDISSAVNVATSTFTGPPDGATASATSTTGVKRAAVSFTSTSSNTSGVTAGEFRQLTGTYGDTSVNFGLEPPRELVGIASETTTLYTGSSTSLVRFGVYFSRSLAVDLVPNNAVIRDYVNGFAAVNAVTDPDTSIYIRAGSFEVQSNLNVRFIDQIDNRNRLMFTVYSVLESSYFIETTLARAQNNDFGVMTEERAFTGTRINLNAVGSTPIDVDLPVDAPFASPFATASSYITTQPLFLTGGRQYQFDFGMDCIVQIFGAARFFQGSTASCDASRSGYWNGLASATDEAGHPIALPDLIGEDGFNYRFASPLSPAVPEPSTWALLIAGLGLLGAVARRRRARAL